MNVKVLIVTSVAVATLILQVGRERLAAQQAPPPAAEAGSKTQWDGIYSDEQAKRGEPLYSKTCASCHGAELAGGDKGPALKGAEFDATWNDKKMGDLSERIRLTMPSDNPASMTRAQNADVLAFLLQKLGAPAGTTALPTNVDQLNAMRYVAKKP